MKVTCVGWCPFPDQCSMVGGCIQEEQARLEYERHEQEKAAEEAAAEEAYETWLAEHERGDEPMPYESGEDW